MSAKHRKQEKLCVCGHSVSQHYRRTQTDWGLCADCACVSYRPAP